MPTFSNDIIIGGAAYALGEDIQVINFRDNPDYSFANPMGGACDPPETATAPGLFVAGSPSTSNTEPASRSAYGYRSDMRPNEIEGASPTELLHLLSDRNRLRHIVIHHDATYTSHGCFGVLCSRRLSTHFMVNHDGGVIQGLDPIYAAYHAGDFNGASIGIDMNNVATVEGHRSVYPDPAFGGTVDYANRPVVEGTINSSEKISFAYTEEQYVTLCALLRLIHDLVDFPLMFPQADDGGVVASRLVEPSNFIGFFGHYHCQAGKWDPGPGFDWARVLEGLHGKAHHWPIDLGARPLRELRSQSTVNEAATAFYAAIEGVPGGGAYPLGLNQQWHDGVHIHAPRGTPVRAVAAGEIVLTRSGPSMPLGSPNFVLMRHTIERQLLRRDGLTGEARVDTQPVDWFSLYMHLDRMLPSEVPPDGAEPSDVRAGTDTIREIPDWYRRLVQIARENKGTALAQTRDHTLADVDANPRLYEELARGLLRTQEYRHAHQCIEDGNPFRWVAESADGEVSGLAVEAGTLLGYVGEFGERLSPDALQIESHPALHFQIFATTPIFDDSVHPIQVWRRVQGDLSGNSLVSSPGVILPILGELTDELDGYGPLPELGAGRVVTPGEIQAFFASASAAQRHRMRTIVARHLSEWDIAVDDSRTANIRALWPWQTDEEFLRWRALHVGYKWLNDDTRDLVGMADGPRPIYTYHPIYLLSWWALNYGRALQGETFVGLGTEQIRHEIEREWETQGDDYFLEGLVPEENVLTVDHIPTGPPCDLTPFTVESGEWHPCEKFDSPLRRP